MAYKTLSEDELESLRESISYGDMEAQKTLEKALRRIAKTANTRLLRIEKNALDSMSNAYERATFYTQNIMGWSNRFRVNKSMDTDDMIDLYREIRYFISRESSTVKGIKIQQERFKKALNAFDINVSKYKWNEFFQFINSDNVQDVIEMIGNYDVVIDAIANNIERMAGDFKKMEKDFNAYLRGTINHDELLERIGGIDYETLYQRHRDRRENLNQRRRRYRRDSR